MRYPLYCLLLVLASFWGCNKEKPDQAVISISSLPMQLVILDDLSGFNPASPNWSIVGKVLSDFNKEQHLITEEGQQVLVNQMQSSGNENLHTTWSHGDLELKLEFMMPKGSNSGIYFQGRYEIQLFDSWKVASPTFSDCGGIYQRWNPQASEGEQGFEGHAPIVNASRAPGLWQQLYVKFVAPKFNPSGEKISNARFERVELNGTTIHQGVELTGATRASFDDNEVPEAPLMLQGDHGNVAFRNIRYKKYSDQKIELGQMSYQYYETPSSSKVPNFDSLDFITQGVADSFNVAALAERDDLFGFRFQAEITVPVSGDYIFHTISDDGSKLFIDQKLVVDNDLAMGVERRSGFIKLAKGVHQLQIDYYNNVWSKYLQVFYEGPEMEYQPFYSYIKPSGSNLMDTLAVAPVNNVELLRGFVNYGDEKRTHAISVGDVSNVHYTYDLETGSLLKSWRGDFADASNMWSGRGHSQLVVPLSPSIELPESAIMASLENENSSYPVGKPLGLVSKGYAIDQDQRPKFQYTLDGAQAFDQFYPSGNGERLIRQTEYEPASKSSLYTRLAVAEYIDLLDNGLYTIGGQYYLELESNDIIPLIRQSDGMEELLVELSAPTNVKYSLLW